MLPCGMMEPGPTPKNEPGHLHPLVVGCRFGCRCSCRHRSAQGLDDASGRNGPRVPIHHMEHLAMLIGTGVRVGVVVDHLSHPFGVLELHLLILVVL
jgi:hypothetical protein